MNKEPTPPTPSNDRLIEAFEKLTHDQLRGARVMNFTVLVVLSVAVLAWVVSTVFKVEKEMCCHHGAPPAASVAPGGSERPLIGSIQVSAAANGGEKAEVSRQALTGSDLDGLSKSVGGQKRGGSIGGSNRVAADDEADEETVPRTANRAARRTKAIRFADENLSAQDQARVTDNCIQGRPKLAQGFPSPTKLVCRDGYVLEHNSIDKIPLWVSERLAVEELTGDAERRNRFRPDPLLAPGTRSELEDYRGSGFDRGHLAPAGNQSREQRLKDETFFLSNMSPQNGPMNQQLWAELEGKVRDWALRNGGAHVITGGMFFDPEEEDAQTADGIIPHEVIGPNSVAVPTHFYKVVVGKKADGSLQAVAFVAENRPFSRPFDFGALVKSIRWIEERTEINFMPDLSPTQADQLELQPGSLPGLIGNN